ncbi:MAG: di-trans,poly-cis-decaprenylcistransferase [Clostridia bacterium]|nr:di-trans,poly-cis-decaprenylcistransferase [Clostridia bacterium]
MFWSRKKKTKKANAADIGVLPRHLAIIMDGNGRWATRRGMPRTAGHKAGSENFVRTVDACDRLGIQCLTVYAFSTENWQRSDDEVQGILKIMHAYIIKYVPELMKKNIRLRILGDLSYFDEESRRALGDSEKKLENNTGLTLCIALSYGGRNEIKQALESLIREGRTEVTEEDISNRLYTAGLPDPDLVIRTGGEKRISNFLLWQSAYAEYYFSDVLWPDFDEDCLLEAASEFGRRKRRFGK